MSENNVSAAALSALPSAGTAFGVTASKTEAQAKASNVSGLLHFTSDTKKLILNGQEFGGGMSATDKQHLDELYSAAHPFSFTVNGSPTLEDEVLSGSNANLVITWSIKNGTGEEKVYIKRSTDAEYPATAETGTSKTIQVLTSSTFNVKARGGKAGSGDTKNVSLTFVKPRFVGKAEAMNATVAAQLGVLTADKKGYVRSADTVVIQAKDASGYSMPTGFALNNEILFYAVPTGYGAVTQFKDLGTNFMSDGWTTLVSNGYTIYYMKMPATVSSSRWQFI